jgi:hypothetical protein
MAAVVGCPGLIMISARFSLEHISRGKWYRGKSPVGSYANTSVKTLFGYRWPERQLLVIP